MSDVRAAAPRPLVRPRPPDAETDLRLARLHLRMGLLGLARAELEALAGADQLGDDGLSALAEARWRTSDLAGAGEAAQADLRAGGQSLVSLVIAAEAIAAVGRPGEARRIAAQAIERADVPLGELFAGMPRSLIWPADPAEAGQPAGTLFPEAGMARPPTSFADAEAAAGEEAALAAAGHGPGFWDAAEQRPLPEPAASLALAERALDARDPASAAVHLAIVLRTGPELAPAVLEIAGRAGDASPQLNLVRGDAYRLVGHELDAQRAWAAAAVGVDRSARDHAHPQEEP